MASRFVPPDDKLRPAHIALGALIVALGFALRWMGADGPLWLDEIWSLDIALSLDAWHKPFWTAFADNSHPLNTAWMYLMGDGRDPHIYRLQAIVLGSVAVAAAGWAMTRGRGRTANAAMPVRVLAAMALMAVMYPFVHYGSEARGYAGMMLFALFAFAAAEDSVDGEPSARWRFALWGALGLMSHAGSVPVMAFLALGHGLTVWHEEHRFKAALDATVRLCAPYALVLTVFISDLIYDVAARGVYPDFGGATDACDGRACFVEALAQLTRFSTGGFEGGGNGLYAALAALISLSWVAWLAALGHRRWLFYAAVLIVQPLLYVAASQPAMPYGRYLLGTVVFWPLLAADVLGEMRARPRLARAVMTGAFATLVLLNAHALQRFFDKGRGDYPDAVAALLDGRTDGTLTVGTNMAFQFETVARHTLKAIAPAVTLDVLARDRLAEAKPDRLVTVTVPARYAHDVYCEGDAIYKRRGTFAHWGLAGADWITYTRRDTPPSNGEACPPVPHSSARFP